MATKTLNTQVKELSVININGNQYLGKLEKTESGVIVKEAVSIDDCDFEDALTKWIKAKNLNKLETIESEGNGISYSTKKFSEEQEMTIDIMCAKAAYSMKYAVANLQNKSF